jgi:hypothetical protein
MSLVLQSSGGGQITIQEPATASNFTQTLPAADGVTMVSGNMPAFSAFNNSTLQSVANNTATKVLFASEDFDTNNNFASSTFTPTVAGYYQINATIHWQTSPAFATLTIYKNGSAWKICSQMSANGAIINGSSIVYCNGTTDYIEIYGTQSSGGSTNIANSVHTWFQGVLVRGA